jgi:AcrR family transcriptional regulator
MAFGKLGRPPEDRLARQREIYQAVSPLILEMGAHRLSMHVAARTACLSVGGLYHYFATKRDLVLHGIQPVTVVRYCQDFHAQYGYLVSTHPALFLNAYLDFVYDAIAFMRPSLHAALELRLETLEQTLAPTLAAANDEFASVFPAAFPHADKGNLHQAGRAINRAIVAALFDRSITAQEFRAEVTALIDGYSLAPQSSVGASIIASARDAERYSPQMASTSQVITTTVQGEKEPPF